MDWGKMLAPPASDARRFRRLWFGTLALAAFLAALAPASAQQAGTPHIGYVYPAGGREGTRFQVIVGGQFLGGVSNAFVSGAGVQAKVIEYNRPLNQKEFGELREELKELQDRWQAYRRTPKSTNVWTAADARTLEEIKAKILKNPPNRRGNPALAERVLVQVTLATNAGAGERELRLGTPIGLSNPLVFRVGQLPEFSRPAAEISTPELDRLRKQFGFQPETQSTKPETRVTLPVTVNGQILPGGVDRYRFTARKGQQLVVAVSARELIPYLADAVPGWFQAALTLFDAAGKQLAHADRYRFHPDPVIRYEIPKDGEYVIQIRDSLYRGREDFVYRVTLGELPFVTSIFPLGGPVDVSTAVELKGWNLTTNEYWTVAPGEFPLPATQERGEGQGEGLPGVIDATRPHLLSPALSSTWCRRGGADPGLSPGVHFVVVTNSGRVSNLMPFAVDTLPECREQETNDSPESALPVTLPIIINGRIGRAGERDVFRFEGRAGERIVAEVYARRLDSPLDSVLRLTDAAGRRLAFNDDCEDPGAGLETHHADSRIAATLAADGTCYVSLGDAQHHGGAEYGYRLRISRPQPDFALRVVPSSLNVRAGMSVPVTAYVLRKDGFTNAVELTLKDAPAGFTLSGGRVPANQDQIRFTVAAPFTPPPEPVNLSLEGAGVTAGKAINHPAAPADDMMQAFAYHHLVCAKELKVAVIGKGWQARTGIGMIDRTPVEIPVGGTALVRMTVPGRAFADRFEFELDGAPEGISLGGVSSVERGLEIALRCDAAKAKLGLSGNLIIQLLPRANPAAAQKGKSPGNQRRSPVGVLPAIPFEVVRAEVPSGL